MRCDWCMGYRRKVYNTISVKAGCWAHECLVIGSCSKVSVLDIGGMAAIFHSLGTTYLDNREVVIDIERSLTFCW